MIKTTYDIWNKACQIKPNDKEFNKEWIDKKEFLLELHNYCLLGDKPYDITKSIIEDIKELLGNEE